MIKLKNIQTSFKTINGERTKNYSTANKELLEWFEQLKRDLKQFQPESPSKLNMGNKDKDKNQCDSAASEGAMGYLTSPQDAHHANRDLSREREAMDATLSK